MPQGKDSIGCAAREICSALRYLGDVSYAIMPADVARSVAEVKKSVLRCLRSGIDMEIQSIDERVAGGDRLREEWREAWSERKTATPAS